MAIINPIKGALAALINHVHSDEKKAAELEARALLEKYSPIVLACADAVGARVANFSDNKFVFDCRGNRLSVQKGESFEKDCLDVFTPENVDTLYRHDI